MFAAGRAHARTHRRIAGARRDREAFRLRGLPGAGEARANGAQSEDRRAGRHPSAPGDQLPGLADHEGPGARRRRAGLTVAKSPNAFRTISEAAEEVGAPQHVLRFWDTKFSFITPLKRAGGRRVYRPPDVVLLKAVRRRVHDEGP